MNKKKSGQFAPTALLAGSGGSGGTGCELSVEYLIEVALDPVIAGEYPGGGSSERP